MAHKEGKGMTGKSHDENTKNKISSAMIGNANAEKYTAEVAEALLLEMLEYCTTEYEIESKVVETESSEDNANGGKTIDKTVKIKLKRNTHLKDKLLLVFKIWNVNWFSHMAAKFKDNETVTCLLQMIDKVCEVNTYEDAVNGVANPLLAKMNLSHHYGWADKTITDNKNTNTNIDGGKAIVNLPEPDEAAKKRWEQSQIKDDE